ncbi:RsmG family class I SAM-dependent methyltransferase, partial [Stenotrophomonas geniculata]
QLTARAMDTLAGIVRVGGHLLRPGGVLLAMKGVYPHEEIADLPAGWKVREVTPLSVPGLAGERHLVTVTGP